MQVNGTEYMGKMFKQIYSYQPCLRSCLGGRASLKMASFFHAFPLHYICLLSWIYLRILETCSITLRLLVPPSVSRISAERWKSQTETTSSPNLADTADSADFGHVAPHMPFPRNSAGRHC